MGEPNPNRIVVCFRWRGGAALTEEAANYARGAEAVIAHAKKLGARVIAWHAVSFAVDFPATKVEEVVSLIAPEESPALAFCIGAAEGQLDVLNDSDGKFSFAWGEALINAWALSRIARAGEVLLEPGMDAVKSGRLLVRGARIGVLGEARLRGLRLDLRHPRQPERGYPSIGLLRSGYLGREPVAAPPGTLGIVSGRRGSGGTRWLEELARSSKYRRTLWLRPRLGESLGSLRRALERVADDPAALGAELGPGLVASFESLAAGDGLDLESSVELISKLLRPTAEDGHSEPGLVLIDDAEHVDADSLEAVARAAQGGSFAVVARVTDGFSVPEALRPLTRAFDVPLEPLPDLAAEQLVTEISGGRLTGAEASRWAKRGGCLPLAIETALADALESGELVTDEEALVGGDASAGPAGSYPSLSLLARRVRRWDPRVRSVLAVLATLGGDSDEFEIAAVLDNLRSSGEEAKIDETMLHALETAEIVQRDRTRVALTSASLRGALMDALSDAERARFHRACSAVLAQSALSLGAVSAAVHSMLGGDVDRALPLARRAAGSLRAAGLEVTAEALDQFGESGDPEPVRVRGLFAGARTERAGLQRSDVPPPSLPDVELSDRPSKSPSGEEAAYRFVQALRHGDHAAMEVLAAEIRDDGAQHVVADRLEGMASLARGQVGDALRRLRGAKERAQALGPGDRSRAALALGVAFAAAGRGTEALLEGLEALARAREANDRHGESACARFLARLSNAAGVSDAAERWQQIVARG